MSFSKEGFEHFKNIFHPNIRENADHYLDNNRYRFPPFHGCGKRNKNGTNKSIDYKRGEQCLFPTEKRYWKTYAKFPKNKISHNVKFTRYMSNFGINYFAKTRKRMWYDWVEKCYKNRSDWYKNKDPFFEYSINYPL